MSKVSLFDILLVQFAITRQVSVTNGGDTQSRNLRKKLAQVSCASFLHQIFVQVHASSADDTSNKNGRSWAKQITFSILSVENENMPAIGSRPIRAHHSSHVHAIFLYGIELCCIRCKKLVQEKSCARNHVRRSSFLYKSTCTSFLYKFLSCVSPP